MAGPALWPIALPVLSGLGGVLIGKFLDVAGERTRWRRDQQAKASAEFNAAAEVLMAELSQDPYDGMRLRCLDAFSKLAYAGAQVDLFGDDASIRAARDLWNYVNELLDNDWEELIAKDNPTWDLDTAAFREYLDRFTNASRHLMGHGPLPRTASPPAPVAPPPPVPEGDGR